MKITAMPLTLMPGSTLVDDKPACKQTKANTLLRRELRLHCAGIFLALLV